jgi:hypothetical protein
MDPKLDLRKQQVEMAKVFKFLATAPLKEGAVKRVLAKAGIPLSQELQNEYLKADPTKFGGDISILVKVKAQTKRLNVVYVGPDTKYGEGWRLWHILNFGTVERVKKTTGQSTGIMPAARFVEKAILQARPSVLATVQKEFAIEIEKYKKRLGFKG